jgi:hypothetical protein
MNGMLLFPEAVRQDPAIDLWLDRQKTELVSLVRPFFARMRQCGDDVTELMHDGCPTACVGEAPFAYVHVFTAHANVGFFYGAELKDPAKLLQGNGKRMRHVKIRPGVVVNTHALNALVDAAYVDVKERLKKQSRGFRSDATGAV